MSFVSTLEELTDRQVEDAERKRELLDTQVSEAQQAVETEVELYKAGYAANVSAKQKELDAIKKARNQALIEEEKAIKKQRQIRNAVLLAEKAAAIAQIIANTAQANAKAVELSPITFGMPWVAINSATAALSIAAIVAAMATAVSAKYAKGGWTGDGTQRDETGERVAGVVHEREFVVRKGPAHKFRDVLEAINRDDRRAIFNSFNRLSPGEGTVNNVVIQNEGPNKRLDEVNSQLRRMNSREEIIHSGNLTIIKKGNNTRIIKR
jgi:hypothetical protein